MSLIIIWFLKNLSRAGILFGLKGHLPFSSKADTGTIPSSSWGSQPCSNNAQKAHAQLYPSSIKLVAHRDKAQGKKCWIKGEGMELAKSGRRLLLEPGAEITSPEDALHHHCQRQS